MEHSEEKQDVFDELMAMFNEVAVTPSAGPRREQRLVYPQPNFPILAQPMANQADAVREIHRAILYLMQSADQSLYARYDGRLREIEVEFIAKGAKSARLSKLLSLLTQLTHDLVRDTDVYRILEAFFKRVVYIRPDIINSIVSRLNLDRLSHEEQTVLHTQIRNITAPRRISGNAGSRRKEESERREGVFNIVNRLENIYPQSFVEPPFTRVEYNRRGHRQPPAVAEVAEVLPEEEVPAVAAVDEVLEELTEEEAQEIIARERQIAMAERLRQVNEQEERERLASLRAQAIQAIEADRRESQVSIVTEEPSQVSTIMDELTEISALVEAEAESRAQTATEEPREDVETIMVLQPPAAAAFSVTNAVSAGPGPPHAVPMPVIGPGIPQPGAHLPAQGLVYPAPGIAALLHAGGALRLNRRIILNFISYAAVPVAAYVGGLVISWIRQWSSREISAQEAIANMNGVFSATSTPNETVLPDGTKLETRYPVVSENAAKILEKFLGIVGNRTDSLPTSGLDEASQAFNRKAYRNEMRRVKRSKEYADKSLSEILLGLTGDVTAMNLARADDPIRVGKPPDGPPDDEPDDEDDEDKPEDKPKDKPKKSSPFYDRGEVNKRIGVAWATYITEYGKEALGLFFTILGWLLWTAKKTGDVLETLKDFLKNWGSTLGWIAAMITFSLLPATVVFAGGVLIGVLLVLGFI